MNSPRPMRAAGWISTPVTTFDHVGQHARDQRHARLVQRVRDAVGEQRLDAAVGEQDLGAADAARGGVALLGRA